ncbi:hypothetical protein HYV31_01575 [candidate division WWE3 bacterium]|nr:hypothetical protein [candidate division WWE3 bacterium]
MQILKNMEKMQKTKIQTVILCSLIFASVIGVVISNYIQEFAIDNSKLPSKVENSKEFQKWIINHKKRLTLEADEFKLKEKNEVFNSANLKIRSVEDEIASSEHLTKIELFKNYRGVRFSPNEFEFLDFRHELRENGLYTENDVYYHGLREDKIIDAKILSCRPELNCFFDRGFFIDNHTFVISEFSRNIEKKDIPNMIPCSTSENCTYTIKLHVFDFINSARFVYESKPFELNLIEMSKYF